MRPATLRGLMRPYESPSSVKSADDGNGGGCHRAYALRYIGGLRSPEVTWSLDLVDPVIPDWCDASKLDADARKRMASRQRSTSFGTALHTIGEDYYEGKQRPAWETFPGKVYESGLQHLPPPEECHEVQVEHAIGLGKMGVDLPVPEGCVYCKQPRATHDTAQCALGWTPDADAPKRALRVHGVNWVGYRDLMFAAPAWLIRKELASFAPDGWMLVDYKSTKSIQEYALREGDLLKDLQAALYAIDMIDVLGIEYAPLQWTYFETLKRRVSSVTRVRMSLDHALAIVEPYARVALELAQYARVEDAPMNPRACGNYGGCQYHAIAGGPCNARQSLGSLVQARVKRGPEKMPLASNIKSAFNKARDPQSAAEPPREPDVYPAPEKSRAPEQHGSSAPEQHGETDTPTVDNTPEVKQEPASDTPKVEVPRKPKAPKQPANPVSSSIDAAITALQEARKRHSDAVSELKKAYADVAAHAAKEAE
jgi:hypothetical protein